jgi:hypothetical protein
MEEQLEQEELRRRLHAAMALRGLKLPQLVEIVHPKSRLGERTLRKLHSGESALTPPILRELAATLDVPYIWFTVPDLARAIHDEGHEGRISALELAIQEIRAERASATRGRAARIVRSAPADDSDTAAPATPRRRRPRAQRS